MIGGPPIYAPAGPRPFMGMPQAPMPGVPGPFAGPIPQQMMPQQPMIQQQQMMPQQPQSWPPVQGQPQRPQALVNDPPVQTVIRGVSAEQRPEPVPQRALEPVQIPSPEQLGVAIPMPHDPGIDWETTRNRLSELGAVGFQWEKLPDGSCRFVCQLATAEFGGKQCIEARATTEAEAVQQALARAELYRRRN